MSANDTHDNAKLAHEGSYRIFLAAAGAGVCTTNKHGIFTDVDERFCQLVGRDETSLVGKIRFSDLLLPDDRNASLGFHDHSLPSEPKHAEVRYILPDGSYTWAVVFASWTGQPGDEDRRWLAASVDITKRKHDEQALRRSEARLAAIFSHSPVGLCELSLTGKFLRVNDELCKLLSRNREELLNMSAADVTHPQDVPHTIAALQKLVESGEPASLDKRYVRPNGEVVFANSAISRLDDQFGNPEVVLAVTIDLTERHHAEAALQQSEARYRTLFECIEEGFCIAEPVETRGGDELDFRYLQVNPAFARQFNLSDAAGKYQSELLPEQSAHWNELYKEVLTEGESKRFVSEVKSVGRWFEVHAFPFGDAKMRQVAAVFADISESVREKSALQEADTRKNEFIAVLAHELRNPLAPIRSGLQILRMTEHSNENTAQLLVLMERQMGQMVRLVDDLLDLSRITQGKIHIQREAICLQEVLESAVEAAKQLITANQQALELKIPENPVEIYADYTRLAQVFSNLLNNAAKYTEAGGRICLIAIVEGKNLLVKVRDTGTGIPSNMLNKIFDPFTQVEHPAARRQGGLGVGLSLAQNLVALHGGHVSARSEGLGKGSEFVVELPNIVLESAVAPIDIESVQEDDLKSHKILVVDDNVDAADALAMMLRMIGQEVRVAYGGPAGLQLAEEFRPELLLLDLGMPELDGYEVARRVRGRAYGRSMQISALTGWGQEEDRRRCREAGFDYHLVKPVDLTTLRQMLQSLPNAARH